MKRLLTLLLVVTGCTDAPAAPKEAKATLPKVGSQIQGGRIYCDQAQNIVLIELKTALRYSYTCHGKTVTLDIPSGYPYAIEITGN